MTTGSAGQGHTLADLDLGVLSDALVKRLVDQGGIVPACSGFLCSNKPQTEEPTVPELRGT